MRDRLPDREYLQEMVRYDPETGRLFFLERPRHKQDNRIENLRAADNFINAQNQKLHSRNKSGVPGVHQTQFGTWYAEITAHRVYHRLGTFKQKSDAIAARKNAERIHGFHPNHGSKT